MANLVFNKTATVSSYVAPFYPQYAVDGNVIAAKRWVANAVPAFISFDLGRQYAINRWVVGHMGIISGWPSPDYNMCDYKLQGSYDGISFYDLDSIVNNTLATTDRSITPVAFRYVRVNVTKGNRNNTNLASIVEFQVYEAPPLLSGLTANVGTMSPAFSSTVNSYGLTVPSGTQTITLTPTLMVPQSQTVTVNGTAVISGTPSAPITLNQTGTTAITVVARGADQALINAYTINVTISTDPEACLTGLAVSSTAGDPLTLEPSFNGSTTFAYTVNTPYELASTPGAYSIKVTPTALAGATITVNNTSVQSGQASNPINLNVGSNTVTIIVTNASKTKQYTLNVVRASNANLTNLVVKAGKATIATIPPFSSGTTGYTTGTISAASVTITPTAADPSAEIKVNGIVVPNNTQSGSISLTSGSNPITVTVKAATGTYIKTYNINVMVS